MTNEEIELGIKELEQFYVNRKKELIYDKGWSWYLTNNAPESFKDLKNKAIDMQIPIADYGNDTCIYSSPDYNYLSRFWHDYMHLTLDRGFSFEDEKYVILNQLKGLNKAGVSMAAQTVFWVDMYHQAKYYNDTGEFVENQKEFVFNILRKYP
tara:strand:+ start:14592 stop:15050 length:459 start_codon:yes stop_codon:yes gene_type:complete